MSLCAGALGACGSQDLNGGLRLDSVDGAASAESTDAPGATTPSGGGGGAGGAGGASCSNVSPCGGDVVGSWTVTSSCLGISGQVNLSTLGIGCASAPITGTLHVTGGFTANANGTYVDTTTTTGEEVISLAAPCTEVSGTFATCDGLSRVLQSGLGYATVRCATVTDGGCTCTATVNSTGGIGRVVPLPAGRGSYVASGHAITLDGDARFAYCASGDTMTWTPQPESPTTTGTIAFRRVGAGGTGGSAGSGGAGGAGGAIPAGQLPCDLYADDAGACVAAHSTVRALSAAYAGPLYQVRRSDGELRDIPVLSPGGFADASVQDAFCGDSPCTISIIYDQSGLGNHLTRAPGGMAKRTPGDEADAMALPLTFGGHKVYGLHVVPGVGYRNNGAVGTATGDNPETIYMVADGKYYNPGCCFDYGNAERTSSNDGEGTMEAVYFGSCSVWGRGAGQGPWVMGDLENGLWPGNATANPSNPSLTYRYVTAMVKGGPAQANRWMIRVGDAQAGGLATVFDGARPSVRYSPMQKEGGIVLGTAGDNSNNGQGNFFEGVMTAHFSSDAADQAVQASIVSAYGP